MEENNNNNNTFKNVGTVKSSNNSFAKSVILPIISGIVGAALAIGICFGVPEVRDRIFSKTSSYIEQNKDTTSSDKSEIDITAINLEDYSNTSIGVANKILPSIVGIEIQYSVNSFFGTSTQSATGSGIIISEDGYILTNNHVVSTGSNSSYYEVSDAKSVKVTLYNDDTVYDAKIIGKDDKTDLAVIKIDKTGLTKATFGDSNKVQIGEFAMAVGCPLGLNTTVTAGIVSAVNREVVTSDNEKYIVIQTDAAINSGNSGGALVNSKGEVIGINTLKLSGTGIEGIGFAIPISSTTGIIDELIDHNKVIRPYIGIEGTAMDEATAKRYNLVEGVYITSVENYTAAQKAGLKVGDVITEVEGEEIETVDDIDEIKEKHKVGDTIKLKVYRNKSYMDIEVTLEEEP